MQTIKYLFSLFIAIGFLSVTSFINENAKVSCKYTNSLNDTILESGFKNPPDTVKPWCYYYWISGNISEEGITKDLEAMAKVGIGEALIANVGLGEPYGKVKILSPEWWRLTEFAIKEGKRLGVDIGIFNSPGWSQSGGPWIKANDAMRYLVSSETKVTGGRPISIKLTTPKDTFQDVAVIAFREPLNDDMVISNQHPIIKTYPSIPGAQKFLDEDKNNPCFFPKLPSGKPFSINIKVKRNFIARTLTLYPAHSPFKAEVEVLALRHGHFRHVKRFLYDRSNDAINVGPMVYGPVAVSLGAISSKSFKIIFSHIRGKDPVPGIPESPWRAGLTEINLSSAPKLENYVEKQLGKMHQTPLPLWRDYQWPQQTESGSAAMYIKTVDVLDISKNMSADGLLKWDAPAGNWVVMRYVATPTGTRNGPASPEATGFEVDKMNRDHLVKHFTAYIGKIIEDMPVSERSSFKHVVADSYEMGSQNYTEGFASEFKAIYGYNPLLWLPVLSGRLIGSAEQSDRFLWDMRRFIADKVATDYVGGLRDLSMKNGLRIWLENYGHWGFPSEFLKYGGNSNEIAGEFWTEGTLGNVECRAASSAAHIYGVNRVYAESFTGVGNDFQYYPGRLKKRGDWSFTEGINHVLLHVYIHQPYEDKNPGMNAWFGTEFNRKNTWFSLSKTWVDYLRRNMFMLQQGKPVNDVCYFIGEDVPKMTGVRDPELPKGYSYDYINADVLLNRMNVQNGKLVLPDGMSYRMMVLPKLATMRPAVLTKIIKLVKDGGIVLGPPPIRSPSLENFPNADREVQLKAKEFWGKVNGMTLKYRKYGRGMIMNNLTMKEAFNIIDLNPDVDVPEDSNILWTHRSASNKDIYFLTNQSDKSIDIEPVFRLAGKQPELWDATTGTIRNLPQYKIIGGRTRIPVHLEPAQSFLFVFRYPNAPLSGSNFPALSLLKSIKTPWKVYFDKNMRGPLEPIVMDSLTDWSSNVDNQIKYYSGLALYKNTFKLSAIPKGKRVVLKFEHINNIAEVKINGMGVGGLWTLPYQVDITNALVLGKNSIEVEVSNLWFNRLVGDAKLPPSERKTWLANNPFIRNYSKNEIVKTDTLTKSSIKTDDKLKPSGLVGSVGLYLVDYN